MIGQEEVEALDPFQDEDLEGFEGLGVVRRRRPKRKGKFEGVDWPLWDTGAVLSAGTTTTLNFFQQPIGQAGKTKLATNMKEAGLISGGAAYVVMEMGVGLVDKAATGIPLAEAREMIETAYLTLTISDREYFSALVKMLPFGGGVVQDAGGAAATTLYHGNGAPFSGAMLKLKRKIKIPQNVHFNINVTWPTAPTPTADTDIVIRLGGILWRTRV